MPSHAADGGSVKNTWSAAASPLACDDLKYEESALIVLHQSEFGLSAWPTLQSPFASWFMPLGSLYGKFMLPERSSITYMSSRLSVATTVVSAHASGSALRAAPYWNVASGMLLSRPPLVPPLPLAPLLVAPLDAPLDAPEEPSPLLPPDVDDVEGNGSLPSLPHPLPT